MRRTFHIPVIVVLSIVLWAANAKAQTWIGFTMGKAGSGVKVKKVLGGSPAAQAGLKRGDLVTSVNGKTVRSPRDVLRIVSRQKVGSRVTIGFVRGGSAMNGSATLTRRPPLAKILKLLLTGERAPNFKLMTLAGRPITLSGLRGKVVVLEFWATWCKSCKISLKKLSGLYHKLKSRGMAVIALARNTLAEVRPVARRLGLPFPVAADPGARTATRYHLGKVPSMVLVDRKGIIREVLLGSSYSIGWLEKRVRRFLKQR